jgi:hypothetical protein
VPDLGEILAEAGGTAAPRERSAGLRRALLAELARGARELGAARSGYEAPVVAAVAAGGEGLVGVAPVAAALRADPEAAGERAWLLVAGVVGALVEVAGLPAPRAPGELALRVGAWDEWLALTLPARDGDAAELAPLAFEEQVAGVDRLRARAHAFPAHVLEGAGDFRAPIGDTHPLRVAEAVSRLGGRPADEGSLAAHEDAVLTLLEPPAAVAAPHADPDPARRIARRILQRLDGMGKWGGYHTEFRHLARGFAGHEAAQALEVGERLLAAGLLDSKPSVGQRHVFLNPRRVADIRALVERGEMPAGLNLG